LNKVVFLVRNQEQAREISETKRNTRVSGDLQWGDNLTATTDIASALSGTRFILFCIPSQTIPDFVDANKQHFMADSIFINCSKGMIISQEKFLNEIFAEQYPVERYVVLSGPSFSSEIFKELPTMVTLASKNKEVLIE